MHSGSPVVRQSPTRTSVFPNLVRAVVWRHQDANTRIRHTDAHVHKSRGCGQTSEASASHNSVISSGLSARPSPSLWRCSGVDLADSVRALRSAYSAPSTFSASRERARARWSSSGRLLRSEVMSVPLLPCTTCTPSEPFSSTGSLCLKRSVPRPPATPRRSSSSSSRSLWIS